MSIEDPTQSSTLASASQSHSHKMEKKHKHKSRSGEKKRKRDHGEDGHRLKSKKRRAERSSQKPDTTEQGSESPFHMQTSSLYLPLAPISQKYPLEGLCAEHISPLILTYYPPFKGVILSYSNPRMSERPFGDDGENTLLRNIDEYAVSWAWVTAEFLLFKPERGAELEGYVNLQNEGHLGLVCWNLFNASVERKRLPIDWKWIGIFDEHDGQEEDGEERYAEAGYFEDGEGKRIEGLIKFRVKEIESSHDRERGFLSIEGTCLSEEDEKQLLESEKAEKRPDDAGRRFDGSKALGATSLGVTVEPDLLGVDSVLKHRRKY